MDMILCELTAISFVVYASINSILFYRLRKEVKNGNGKHEEKKTDE